MPGKRMFVAVEFFRNRRGRLEVTDVFLVEGIRSARAVTRDPDTELNAAFAVYEVVDGELAKFNE